MHDCTKAELVRLVERLRTDLRDTRLALLAAAGDHAPACPVCAAYKAIRSAMSRLRRRNRLHADGDGPDLGCVCRLLDAPGKGRAGEGVTE